MNTKLKPIPELDDLPEEKREQLHQWLEDCGYRKSMAKLKEEWGLSITYNKIYRYFQRVLQKRQYEQHLDHQIAMPEYLAILNGEPVPYSQAGIQTIQKRAFELACAPGISASNLATLLRIFHYKKALEVTDRRLQQTDRRNDIAETLARVKQEELADRRAIRAAKTNPLKSKQDALGQLIRKPEDIERRADAKFGLTPPLNSAAPAHAPATGDQTSCQPSDLQLGWPAPHQQPATIN